MAPLARTLQLTLDACDAGLVRRYIAEGDLPNLRSFFAQAATTETQAPDGLFVSSMWPTIFTATTVDRHGYHCWDVIEPGTYARRETSPDEIIGTPFWEHLSDAGQRIAVLDVPHSKVRRPVDGVMLVEWGCHDRHFGTHSWPEPFVDEINASVGPHPVGTYDAGRSQFAPCDYLLREGRHRTPDEDAALLERILLGVEHKEQVSLELLQRGGWDLFLSVFGESHCVGHQLWRVSDPSHPWHDPALAARLGDPIRRVYQRLDAAVGRHLDAVGAGATVALHLSHGMAAHYDGTHLLQEILGRLEARADGEAVGGWRTRLAGSVLDRLPDGVRTTSSSAVAALVRRRVAVAPPPPTDPDVLEAWTQGPDRLWFQAPNNTVTGGIRLNLAGRESAGRIPQEEQRRVAAWLRRELLQVVNIDTGRPAILDVEVTDEVYGRSSGDVLPDLFIEWDRSAMIERVWSPTIGTIVRRYNHWRTGDHTREGFLAIAGPGTVSGRRGGVLEAVDIAPTIAATLGVELPGVDGRPRLDLLPGSPAVPPAPPDAPWGRPDARERAVLRLRDRFETLRVQVDGLGKAHHLTRVSTIEAAAADAVRGAELSELRSHLDGLDLMVRVEVAGLAERTSQLEALQAATTWAAHIPARNDVLVSVIMPTRDRSELLGEAIASVQAQRHHRWELIVVDDGSQDDTAALLTSMDDPRIKVLTTDGVGCAAARNLALDAASGDVVAYLDDDNLFHGDWLVAVSWMFHSLPDLRVAYGARVIEDEARAVGKPASGRPMLQLNAWDREAIERANTLDMNVLAHRPSPIRFDERIAYFGDWDLVLKLSEETDPMPIPVIAALYSTSATGRLSDVFSVEAKRAEAALVREGVSIRSRARRRSG